MVVSTFALNITNETSERGRGREKERKRTSPRADGGVRLWPAAIRPLPDLVRDVRTLKFNDDQ